MPSPESSSMMPTRRPATPSQIVARTGDGAWGIDVESSGSWPASTSYSSAASATLRARGPIWSSELANAISPYRLTAPYVGFMPTSPHRAAGWRIEPPVSEPMPSAANPAATAAALPPDDPPGTREGSCGLRLGPNAEFSVEEPMANSSRLVLPTKTAPAAAILVTTVAS